MFHRRSVYIRRQPNASLLEDSSFLAEVIGLALEKRVHSAVAVSNDSAFIAEISKCCPCCVMLLYCNLLDFQTYKQYEHNHILKNYAMS
jgi:hypothetical protein